jgi:hypothetical protein
MKNKLGRCRQSGRLVQRALRAKRSTAIREVRATSNGKRDPIVNSISSAFSEVDLRIVSSILGCGSGRHFVVRTGNDQGGLAEGEEAARERLQAITKPSAAVQQRTHLVDAAAYCTRAGLIEQAALLWGNAGQWSLAGLPLVKANEQFTRALDQIAALPATLALRREWIKLQVPKAECRARDRISR